MPRARCRSCSAVVVCPPSHAEPQKFPLTPFLRGLLVSEKMKALKTLQEQCPAYLGLGEKLEELHVLGTSSDQRATLVRERRWREA